MDRFKRDIEEWTEFIFCLLNRTKLIHNLYYVLSKIKLKSIGFNDLVIGIILTTILLK